MFQVRNDEATHDCKEIGKYVHQL